MFTSIRHNLIPFYISKKVYILLCPNTGNEVDAMCSYHSDDTYRERGVVDQGVMEGRGSLPTEKTILDDTRGRDRMSGREVV